MARRRRQLGDDFGNSVPKRRVKMKIMKRRFDETTTTTISDLRSRARHAQRRAQFTRDDVRGTRGTSRDGQ
jgi:hypothetical protein